jgi:hypothetical protein
MATTLTEANLDPRAEKLFRDWNMKFQLEPAYPIADIRRLDGAQVRDVGNIAPEEGVAEYATQMKAGAAFPPIVLMGPNILLDGNTRLLAAASIGQETFPAYVVDVPTVDMGKSVAGALNQLNGRRLTGDEAQRLALILLHELHFNDEQVSAYIGRSAQQVRLWRREHETEDRARRLGLGDKLDAINDRQRERIASITHDAPFAETVKLLSDIKVRPGDLRNLVNAVVKAPSEADELELVTRARTELVPVGPPPRRAQANKVARMARMNIAALMKAAEDPLALLDPSRLEEDRKAWEVLRERADAVLAFLAQQQPPTEPML